MKIGLDQLAAFLVEANRHTYAADTGKVASSLSGSKDLEFSSGNLRYHDTYFGSRRFMGVEVVYENELPIWAMSYSGHIADADAKTAEVYGFLRQALLESYGSLPVRGPGEFNVDDWLYISEFVGGDDSLEHFQLEERIYRPVSRLTPIYRGSCSGGLL